MPSDDRSSEKSSARLSFFMRTSAFPRLSTLPPASIIPRRRDLRELMQALRYSCGMLLLPRSHSSTIFSCHDLSQNEAIVGVFLFTFPSHTPRAYGEMGSSDVPAVSSGICIGTLNLHSMKPRLPTLNLEESHSVFLTYGFRLPYMSSTCHRCPASQTIDSPSPNVTR